MDRGIAGSPEMHRINTPKAMMEIATLNEQMQLEAPSNIPPEEKITPPESTDNISSHYNASPETGQPKTTEKTGVLERLQGTKLGRTAALAGTVIALAAAGSTAKDVISPSKAKAEVECTYETVTSPDGHSTSYEKICSSDGVLPSAGNGNAEPRNPKPPKTKEDSRNTGDNRPNRDKGKKARHNNLLPVPKKRTRRHWATKIINEIRKGKKGRITASPQAKKDLYQARRGQCSKAEQKPGVCSKLDKTLLKVLYKASHYMRYYIWHFTSGPHVATSHHWPGDAADLRRYNGKAPRNKAIFPIIRRVTPKNKNLELIGPGDDPAHTGKKDGHWHTAVY